MGNPPAPFDLRNVVWETQTVEQFLFSLADETHIRFLKTGDFAWLEVKEPQHILYALGRGGSFNEKSPSKAISDEHKTKGKKK